MKSDTVFDEDDGNEFELDDTELEHIGFEAYDATVRKSDFIKEELRQKIQSRRISAGLEELKVEFDPLKTYQLTVEEELKLEIRKQRNRQSANRSRLKRKWKLEHLATEENKLVSENHKLKAKITALQQFKLKLETVWSSHLSNCKKK